MRLSKRQGALLEEAHDLHEGVGAGLPARFAKGDQDVDALIVAGLLQRHPPGKRPRLIIPTPLGRGRVLMRRERRAKRQPGQ